MLEGGEFPPVLDDVDFVPDKFAEFLQFMAVGVSHVKYYDFVV